MACECVLQEMEHTGKLFISPRVQAYGLGGRLINHWNYIILSCLKNIWFYHLIAFFFIMQFSLLDYN